MRRRTTPKVRRGGVLVADLEQRFLAGETRALRALVRQGVGVNRLTATVDDIEIREAPAGKGLVFTGYASVTDTPYVMQDWLGEYTEVVDGGAFDKTLRESPDVIFCLNHDWSGAPMARTGSGSLKLLADETGLLTEARLDANRADVYQVRSAMEAGDLSAMSFAFFVTRQQWSPDYEQRNIIELDMDGGDTSVVTWPANPATDGTTDLRAAQALLSTEVPGLVVERARAERREGKTHSAATVEQLQAIYDLVALGGDSTATARDLVGEMLGDDLAAASADEPDEVDGAADVDSGAESTDDEQRSDGPDKARLALRLAAVGL